MNTEILSGEVNDLFNLAGISKGATLLIHSAFRSLSHQGIRAETFLDYVLNYLEPSGTLLIPTMSWRICTPQNPYFSVRTTPGNVGILAEVFRKHYAVARSIHPTHSVAGYGPDVGVLLHGHHLATTPCPSTSGFHKVSDKNGVILLLGVGLECCTLFHCAEEAIAPEIYLEPLDKAETYSCYDFDETLYTVKVRRHRRVPRYFSKLFPLLLQEDILTRGSFRGVPWIAIKAKGALDIARDLLQKDCEYFLNV